MRRGGRVLILLGLILAILSGVGVFVVLATATPGQAEIPRTRVVIATQPIAARTEITADQLMVTSWPVLTDFPVPPGSFEEPQSVVGKLSNAPIAQGQALTAYNLVDKDAAQKQRSNASFILDKGTVALSLPLSQFTSVGNAVQIGDRVDLLATFTAGPVNPPPNSPPSTTVTQRMLQNVLVLQVGPWPNPQVQASSSNQGTPANVITLQIAEQDALVLKYTEGMSDAWTFALRPVNDEQQYNPTPVNIDYINRRFGFNFAGVLSK